MNRRGTAAAVALAVSVGLVLSACDGDEQPTEPPTSETSESASTTEPATDPTTDAPTPPEVEAPTPAPEAAVDDHVGAIWAARYFLDLYAYMRQTGDTAQFEAMSAPECQFCASAVENATELHDGGGWAEGGELVFEIDDATAEYPTGGEPNFLVRFEATEQPSVTHASDGTSTEKAGAVFDAVIAMQFIDGRFIVFGVNAE